MYEMNPGDQAGPYTIQNKIEDGHGGMATVYQAVIRSKYRQYGWPRFFAVKIAAPDYEDFLKRESGCLALLNHSHIVRIFPVLNREERHIYLAHTSTSTGRVPFFAMEYLAGGSLDKLLTHQRMLPLPTVLQISRKIASALAHIHQQGIIHLDVKPKNILFRRPAGQFLGGGPLQPVLCDFGLARGLSYPPPLKIGGTPEYISPEQFLEAGGKNSYPVDYRSDIFSLGVVLYQMLTGRLPFENPADLMINDPISPSAFNPHLSPLLESIVLRCLAKDPAHRYQAAWQLEQELAAVPTTLAPWRPLVWSVATGIVLIGAAAAAFYLWPVMASILASTATVTATPAPSTEIITPPAPVPSSTLTRIPARTTGEKANTPFVTSTALPTHTVAPVITPKPTATPTTAFASTQEPSP